ncbi:major facilitator superfamily protein [Stylonychia lemnae]|uniref:Lysosomal dipeptide transporter MFSD1 n=1 Tax=Stylonychia lemnae TaxID=5949 RepID=A0A078AKK7_STYLE|nr:major facilitator superfamily protein [Stylonychia lemnae]|eukprot:CDW82749.1 major facilitator superfamily protein [Stylonychia lemnae]
MRKTSGSTSNLSLEIPLIEERSLDKKRIDPNPKEASVRYAILLLVCYLKFVTYYTTESPGSIKQEVVENFKITNLEFGMLFSIYNLPNIVLSLLTGIFIDKVGIRKSNLIFTVLVLIGQVIYTLSCYGETNYQLALIGRFILGASAESSSLVYIMIINHWFSQKELGFACSVLITIAKAGVSLTNFLSPYIYYNTQSLGHSFMAGVVLAIVGVLLCYIFNIIDQKFERNAKISNNTHDLETRETNAINDNSYQEQNEQQKSSFSLKLLSQLSRYFWFFILANFISYMTLGPFQINFSQILRVRYNFDIVETGYILGYIAIVLTCLGPVLGIISDRIDKRMGALAFGNMILFLVQAFFAFTPNYDQTYLIIIPLALFEFEISPPHIFGFCLGLMNSFQNMSMAIAPLLIGSILDVNDKDLSKGYVNVSFVLGALNLASALIIGYIGLQQQKYRFN